MKNVSATHFFAALSIFSVSVFSASVFSDTQKIVAQDTQNKLYILNKVTAEQANYGVFNLSIPENGSVAFVVNGDDKFISSTGIPSYLIKRDGRSAYFDFSTAGKYSIAASTECGVTISAIVNVYAEDNMPTESQLINKVAFEAPDDCKLHSDK